MVDLHLDGTQHDPDAVGPQPDVDESSEALTTREYVVSSCYQSSLLYGIRSM